MNRQLLMVLAVAALAVVGVATWLSGERAAAPQAPSGGALVPGLADRVNDIPTVTITDGESSVTLNRQNETWVVAERGNYPADIQQLRRRLVALVEAKRLEPKTANPERYSQLGVSDVAEDDGDDQNLKITLAGDTPTELLVGKRASGGTSGTYVRFAGEAASWLASGDLRFSSTAKDWLKKDVLDVSPGRVKAVELVRGDGSVVTMVKGQPEDPNFAVTNVPEGRELLSPSVANSIASALSALRFDDVRPVAEENFQAIDIVQGTFETFDGLRVNTRAWEKDDKRYVMLDVAFDESLVPPAAEPQVEASATPATPADDAGDEAIRAAAEAAQAELVESAERDAAVRDARELAESIQPSVSGWIFEIPSYKYGNLSKSMEDLLKPLEDTDSEASGG